MLKFLDMIIEAVNNHLVKKKVGFFFISFPYIFTLCSSFKGDQNSIKMAATPEPPKQLYLVSLTILFDTRELELSCNIVESNNM